MRFSGIDRAFDGFVICGGVGLGKPDINIFNRFLDISGLAAEESVFVDDRPKNLAVASMSGFPAILFGAEPEYSHKAIG